MKLPWWVWPADRLGPEAKARREQWIPTLRALAGFGCGVSLAWNYQRQHWLGFATAAFTLGMLYGPMLVELWRTRKRRPRCAECLGKASWYFSLVPTSVFDELEPHIAKRVIGDWAMWGSCEQHADHVHEVLQKLAQHTGDECDNPEHVGDGFRLYGMPANMKVGR